MDTVRLCSFNGRHRHFGLDNVISMETGDPYTFQSFAEFQGAGIIILGIRKK